MFVNTMSTRRDVNVNDDVKTFIVTCANDNDAKSIKTFALQHNATLCVYRATYDAIVAQHTREIDKRMRIIAIASMSNAKHDVVERMNVDIREYAKTHDVNFDEYMTKRMK